MRRRQFLHTLSTAPAASLAVADALAEPQQTPSTEGLTQIAEFTLAGDSWKVWEDLQNTNGSLGFVSSHGKSRTLTKSGESTEAEDGPQHLAST